METHWLVLLLLSPLPIMAAVGLYAWQQRAQFGARLLLALMAFGSLATVAYIGELFSSTLGAKLFWLQLWYLGAVLLAPLVLLLALWQLQFLRWLTPRRIALIFVPAAIILLLFYTNRWHHQFYVSFGLDTTGELPLRTSVRGPLYWVTQLVVSVYMLGAIYVLAIGWRNTSPPYSTQAAILLLATIAPMAGNILHLLGIDAFGYVNLTSLSLMVTGLTYGWGIARHRMFDLVPVIHQTILQHMSSGVVVVDRRGRILEINPAACATFGTTRGAAIGAPLPALCAPWPALATADLGAAGGHVHEVIVGPPASQRTLLITSEALPAVNLPPEAAHTVLLIQDVTARRAAERASQAQQRQLVILEERERMARDLHDGVGQVLGYVSAQTQAAREYLHGGQGQMADATLAHLAAVAQDAHADLRNFILGATPVGVQPAGLAAALEQLVARFSTQYGQPVTLAQSDVREAPWVSPAEQAQLLYVVQEALTNVRKHAQTASATVHCHLDEAAIDLVVADEGPGFDPQQVDGQHFGLRIMQARMEEIGGRLEVAAAPGRGTQIHAHLPRKADAPPSDALCGLRVLLADDQPLFRDGLHNLLAARGIQVVGVAEDGEEAVRKAHELLPDVVIMDIHMPGCDGLAATERIKQALPAVKVLVLTVAETDATLLEALRRGASGYLLKNLDAQTLFTMLERLQAGETVLTPAMATHLVDQFARGHGADDLMLSERQQEILQLMAEGYTYREIAGRVHLSESAVKYNAGQVLERLHARTRAEAVRMAERRGLL